MEKVNGKSKSLKVEFSVAVAFTLLIVVIASAATIYGCWRLQKYLLPDPNAVVLHAKVAMPNGDIREVEKRFILDSEEDRLNWLVIAGEQEPELLATEFSIESIEASLSTLTPKKKILYRAAGVSMVALPLVYSVLGIAVCAWWFYRKKLTPAIHVLDDAMHHISEQDLDFTISCESQNELGRLCVSFEKMRQALYENNLQLWKMIEQQKMVQASIAHDLRNPIAIIEGYAEYLQINTQTGRLTMDQILQITDNMDKAAKRLGQYTESIRTINQLDDIEVSREQIPLEKFIEDINEDLSLMAAGKKIRLNTIGEIPKGLVQIDTSVLFRVLENMINNALRFAKETISLSFEMENQVLTITILDDGVGFPQEILRNKTRLLMPMSSEDGHCGLGITISRLLCKKHDGRLELLNNSFGGATVKIIVRV